MDFPLSGQIVSVRLSGSSTYVSGTIGPRYAATFAATRVEQSLGVRISTNKPGQSYLNASVIFGGPSRLIWTITISRARTILRIALEFQSGFISHDVPGDFGASPGLEEMAELHSVMPKAKPRGDY